MKSIIVVGAVAIAGVAQAQESAWYADVGIGQFKVNEPDNLDEFNVFRGRVGFDFHRYIGIEADFASGLNDAEHIQSITVSRDPSVILSAAADVSLDWSAGVFARVKTPLSKNFEVYAKGGYVSNEYTATRSETILTSSDIQISQLTSEVDGSFDGVAFGVGGTYLFHENTGLRFDWMRQQNDNSDGFDLEADAYTVSVYQRF